MKSNKVFQQIDWIIIFFFCLSLLNSATVILFYVVLLLYLRDRYAGGVKALFWLTTRGLLSNAAGASVGSAAMIKMALLIGFSVWTMMTMKVAPEDRRKLRTILGWGAAFSVFAVLGSFLSGSYPVTSAFKAISFYLPFCAVMIGIAATHQWVDWTSYYIVVFGVLFAISLFVMPIGRFRTVNRDFQGVFNHVNVFGVLSAMMIAMVLNCRIVKNNLFRWAIIGVIVFMEYQSRSRTGMLSLLAVLVMYYFVGKSRWNTKALVGVTGVILILIVSFVMPETAVNVSSMASEFMMKGQEINWLASRFGQVDMAMLKFTANPVTGSGFMTPYYAGYRELSLNFNLIVEPGNMLYAVLGDTGIIGSILFFIFLCSIYLAGDKGKLYLLAGALMINMGEMVFFSANNMSVLVYMLMALYVFNENEGVQYA